MHQGIASCAGRSDYPHGRIEGSPQTALPPSNSPPTTPQHWPRFTPAPCPRGWLAQDLLFQNCVTLPGTNLERASLLISESSETSRPALTAAPLAPWPGMTRLSPRSISLTEFTIGAVAFFPPGHPAPLRASALAGIPQITRNVANEYQKSPAAKSVIRPIQNSPGSPAY